MRRLKFPLAVVGGLSSALIASGCTKVIDEGKLADAIKKSNPNIKSVSCPSGKDSKTGNSFTCTATNVDGSTTTYQITVTDGNAGNVTYQPLGGTGGSTTPGSTDTTGATSSTDTSGSTTDTTGSTTDTTGSTTDTTGQQSTGP